MSAILSRTTGEGYSTGETRQRPTIAQATRYADNVIALRDGEPYDWGLPAEVVTEELLADVFGVAATVREGSEVVPHRPL